MTVDGRTALSFAHLAALDVGPPELIDLVARAGFASTSIRMLRGVSGSPEYPLADPAQRRATKDRMRATSVGVLYVELVPLGRDLAPASLRPLLDAGADLGATRIIAAGDDPDHSVVADRLAAVCELARGHGMAVDLEFMPFREVRTLAEAADVIRRSGASNAHILLDALHFYRSGSTLAELRGLDPRLLGTFQLCDAPRAAPADLTFEARNARLLPGEGGLDLSPLIALLPPGLPIGVEVPMALSHPHLDHAARLGLQVEATRAFLARLA